MRNRTRVQLLTTKIGITMALAASLVAAASPREEVNSRLDESTTVLSEILEAPDKGIPQDLLDDAHCVAIVPSLKKGAFIVGGQYGKGFLTCREGSTWSAPAAIRMEGGSFGFQIGGSETDVVLLVMNDHGVRRLLQSQFTLGAEGEVAAGPVGRESTAQTDAKFGAEILSWSRSRGVFAGISLKGSTLRQDVDANEAMYGKPLENREIVGHHVRPTAAGRRLILALSRASRFRHE